MKHISLLLSICLFTTSSSAQLTQNTWLVGGSGSLFSYHETYNSSAANFTAKYTSIDISPSVGYFLIDKLSGGLRATFSSIKGESSGGGSMNNYKLAIGPFVRYYFLNADKQFNILTDVSYQFGVNRDFGGLSGKGKFNIFSLMGGTEVFFNSTAGMEILLGYSQKISSIENSPPAATNNEKGFQVSIGFQLHLEKD